MCGICVICQPKASDCKLAVETSRLLNRGPDAYNNKDILPTDGNAELWFHGCVLVLRHHLVPQPLIDGGGNALLWNGEIFGGIEVSNSENDGMVLLEQLQKASSDTEIVNILGLIQGPWSFAYWQNETQKLWFGRDIFGRRSLLWSLADKEDSMFALSSVKIDPLEWSEVPAVGIFSLNTSGKKMTLYPWKNPPAHHENDPGINTTKVCDIFKDMVSFTFEQHDITAPVFLEPFNMSVPCGTRECDGQSPSCVHGQESRTSHNSSKKCSSEICTDLLQGKNTEGKSHIDNVTEKPSSNATDSFLKEFDNSSGAVCDSSGAVCEELQQNKLETRSKCGTSDSGGSSPCDVDAEVVPKSEGCDFPNQRQESSETGNNPQTNRCERDSSGTRMIAESKLTDSRDLLRMASKEQLELSERFLTVLGNAVKVRAQSQMKFCDKCLRQQFGRTASPIRSAGDAGVEGCRHARVGVLFSGGIDSLMIAALADRFVAEDEPIDLMNVAFEQPVKKHDGQKGGKKPNQSQNASKSDPYLVPDRITGLAGLEELKMLNPKRKWNFVEINITVDELKKMRDVHICHLVYPLQTVLDDSIGCAVWFAARGEGIIRTPGEESPVEYKSTARVILVGMGADEQLGGYSRHRNVFRTGGWLGLEKELRIEINRISERNLGRDDRIITDHGKESRFPFLDENVVSFLNSLPVQEKADLRLERGFGEKIILRRCAALLGLHNAAVLPKRAIQFGSRIAKVEDRKEKASDVCGRLKNIKLGPEG